MRSTKIAALAIAMASGLVGTAFAQSGPVATSCASDIGKLCANRPHDGSTRICLEQAYSKLSAVCKSALDRTGGGRGKALGKGRAKGKAKAS